MTMNGWLAIIAISSILQLVIFIVFIISAQRFYQRASTVLDEVRVETREIVERVKRADDAVRQTMRRAGTAVGTAVLVTRRGVWPLIGLARGLGAAASALFRSSHQKRNSDTARARRAV